MVPSRVIPLVLPAVAVAVVAVALLVVGRPRPVVAARLRGGPTEGARFLSFRLEVVERLGDAERAVTLRDVTVDASFVGGKTASWSGRLDDEGAAAVSFTPPEKRVHGPVQLRVSLPSVASEASKNQVIADAAVSLSPVTWAAAARRRGGEVKGHPSGGLTVSAAAERGVFAVPFADELWIDVRDSGNRPVSDVSVQVTAEGGQLAGGPVLKGLHAFSQVWFTPEEHAASVSIVAHPPEGPDARLDVSLAVVPGALHVAQATHIYADHHLLDGRVEDGYATNDGIVVESPILRDRAYVAIVTASERVAGGTVMLSPDGRGGSKGVFPLSHLPVVSIWAVVSSEPDLHSESLVGWPIGNPAETEQLPKTFDVPDVLVIDTVGDALRLEATRVRRVRLGATAFATLALALTALFVVRGAKSARAGLEAHLDDAGADHETATRIVGSGGGSTWLVVAAVLTFALAAVMVGVFALWR